MGRWGQAPDNWHLTTPDNSLQSLAASASKEVPVPMAARYLSPTVVPGARPPHRAAAGAAPFRLRGAALRRSRIGAKIEFRSTLPPPSLAGIQLPNHSEHR